MSCFISFFSFFSKLSVSKKSNLWAAQFKQVTFWNRHSTCLFVSPLLFCLVEMVPPHPVLTQGQKSFARMQRNVINMEAPEVIIKLLVILSVNIFLYLKSPPPSFFFKPPFFFIFLFKKDIKMNVEYDWEQVSLVILIADADD